MLADYPLYTLFWRAENIYFKRNINKYILEHSPECIPQVK